MIHAFFLALPDGVICFTAVERLVGTFKDDMKAVQGPQYQPCEIKDRMRSSCGRYLFGHGIKTLLNGHDPGGDAFRWWHVRHVLALAISLRKVFASTAFVMPATAIATGFSMPVLPLG